MQDGDRFGLSGRSELLGQVLLPPLGLAQLGGHRHTPGRSGSVNQPAIIVTRGFLEVSRSFTAKPHHGGRSTGTSTTQTSMTTTAKGTPTFTKSPKL